MDILESKTQFKHLHILLYVEFMALFKTAINIEFNKHFPASLKVKFKLK